MNEKLIGILAGMGPRSTAPFLDLVIDECQTQYGAKYDIEFPKMMIYSLPTPFYVDREIDHEMMKEILIEGLKKMESIGVSFIAMPCNSIHIYFDELKNSINIPLLNIVDETVKKLPKSKQKVTLFSTRSTFDSQIYQSGILSAGHEFIFKDEWQIQLNTLIQNIKTNKDNLKNAEMFNELIESVKNESINTIIIACTDLNVLLDKLKVDINIIDSAKCLSESIINKYLEKE